MKKYLLNAFGLGALLISATVAFAQNGTPASDGQLDQMRPTKTSTPHADDRTPAHVKPTKTSTPHVTQTPEVIVTAAPAAEATKTPEKTVAPVLTTAAAVIATPCVSASGACVSGSSSSAPTSGLTTEAATSASTTDQNYLIAVAQTNLFEIAAANLALEKATRADVSDFAQILLTDHTQSLANITSLAASVGATLPTTITAAQAVTLDGLTALTGAQFDVQFVHNQRVTHEASIDLAATEVQQGTNESVKQTAANSLPVLIRHYQLAASLEGLVPSAFTCIGPNTTAATLLSTQPSRAACSKARKACSKAGK